MASGSSSGAPVTLVFLELLNAAKESLSLALKVLVEKGVKLEQFIVSFIAAPQGLVKLQKDYPDTRVLVAQIDVTLNENNLSCQAWETLAIVMVGT